MSAVLSVMVPVPITDSMLISSTAPENDYPAYAAGTTYAIGDRCINTATHRIYESMRATNLAHDPTILANQSGSAPWWLDLGPTNRWAMFDGEVSTQTVAASPLTVVIRPGAFNGEFLGGLDAERLLIVIRDAPGGNIIFSYDATLEDSAPADYYEYFFDRFKPQTDFLARDLDPYGMAEMTVTLTSTTAPVKCGMLAVGDLRPLGLTQYGATASPKSWSFVTTDKFGNTSVKKGKSAKDITASSQIDIADANSVLATLTDVMGVPCLCVGTDLPEYGGLRSFGLVNGKLTYPDIDRANLDLTAEGMI